MKVTAYGPDTHRVGILNAPTTTNKGGKKDLLAPRARVRAMLAIFVRLGLAACGLVEVGTITRVVLRLHPRWVYLPGGANTVTPRNRKGSALILRARDFTILDRRGLKVPYPKGWRRRLIQPRVLTADPRTGRRILWMVGHAPRKVERVANLQVLHALGKACQEAIAVGLNVVLLVDTNNLPGGDAILAQYGMRRVANQDVLAVYVSPAPGVRRTSNGVVRNGVAKVITDHGGLAWAVLEFLTREGFVQVNKIPEDA